MQLCLSRLFFVYLSWDDLGDTDWHVGVYTMMYLRNMQMPVNACWNCQAVVHLRCPAATAAALAVSVVVPAAPCLAMCGASSRSVVWYLEGVGAKASMAKPKHETSHKTHSQQRSCWVSINLWGWGVVTGKFTPPKTGTVLDPAGTLRKSCWNLPGTVLEPDTLLEPRWDLAGTLLRHSCNSAGTCWNLAGALLLELLAGTSCWEPLQVWISFFFLDCFFFLLCLMCRVVMWEVWLELGWSRFATLLEPIWRQFLGFLWVLFCFFLFPQTVCPHWGVLTVGAQACAWSGYSLWARAFFL